jgi:hypothetical protein
MRGPKRNDSLTVHKILYAKKDEVVVGNMLSHLGGKEFDFAQGPRQVMLYGETFAFSYI